MIICNKNPDLLIVNTKSNTGINKLKNFINPKVIAIDIDISPGPSGARSNYGQLELDQWLQKSSKQNTRYVLVTPFPVADEKLIQEK